MKYSQLVRENVRREHQAKVKGKKGSKKIMQPINPPAGRDPNLTFRLLDKVMPKIELMVADRKKQQREETQAERMIRLNGIARKLSEKIREHQKSQDTVAT